MKSRWLFRSLLAVSALLAHACGGKVEDAPESVPSGGGAPFGGGGAPFGGGGAPFGGGGAPFGGGGVPFGGGAGGAPWGGGGSPFGGGGSAGTPCAGCPSYKIGGILDAPACCPSQAPCGIFLNATLGTLVGLPQGCYPTDQPGAPDPSCASLVFTNPLDGGLAQFPGCCNAFSGTCGAMIDLQSVGGPNLGCTDYGAGGGGPQKCGGTSGNCEACVQAQCGSELSQCSSQPACSTIFQCLQACMDQACADKCLASYPAGKALFYAFVQCVDAKCQPECQ